MLKILQDCDETWRREAIQGQRLPLLTLLIVLCHLNLKYVIAKSHVRREKEINKYVHFVFLLLWSIPLKLETQLGKTQVNRNRKKPKS